VPLRYAQLGTICTSSQCGDQQPTPSSIPEFHAAGITLGFYATYIGTLEVLYTLLFLVIAAVVYWRKSETLIGLITALFLVTYGVTQTSANALASAVPILSIPVNLLQPLSFILLVLFLYLFPDGRFTPRWTGFVFAVWVPVFLATSTLLPPGAFAIPLFGFIIISLFAQIYRYLRVSSPQQRQQTKWVVFGVLIGILGSLGIIGAVSLLPFPQTPGSLGFLVGDTLIYLFSALFPLSIGIAIMRSRLWDIDVIINKVLVYGLLTALLGAIYAGLILGVERLLGVITGQVSQQPVVLVISTLAIAALFQPMRRRIQQLIDRRFYRRKYDATRTVAAFSATLRNEVELSQLSDHLLNVVRETMQPEHVFLWLREGSQKNEPPAAS
jgi:hypothetical protein